MYRNPKEALNLFMRLIETDKEFRYKFEYPYVDFYISDVFIVWEISKKQNIGITSV